MPARYVQPLRVLIQTALLVFFCLTGVRFWSFVNKLERGLSVTMADRPAGIEGFLPLSGLVGLTAWMKGLGLNDIHPAAVVILLTVLVMCLLLRRSFCSWVCPVAALSEWSWKAGFRVAKRNVRVPRRLDVALRTLKYLLLVFFLWSICLAMPPEMLRSFIASDYHKIADIRLLDFFAHISPRTLGFVLVMVLLSLALRNPFCRYLCPYGALLGLVAFLSPARVTRDSSRCVSCGICSQVCPASIDVMHKTSVSSPECIGCWRCVSHCRFNEALTMSYFGRIAFPGVVFAALVMLILWGGSVVGKRSGHWYGAVDMGEYRRILGQQLGGGF